ncbi:RNA recognition motif domain protein [Entamoeba marina]
MSQQQLSRLLQEKERLTKNYERSKNLMKVSDACADLVNFTKSKVDPFSPDYKDSNPWNKDSDGGCCIIL